jgi:Protein of unknown function (DUF3024)
MDEGAHGPAPLRYEGDGTWTLFFGNGSGKWVIYPHLGTSQPVGVILDEIAVDPACVFWG